MRRLSCEQQRRQRPQSRSPDEDEGMPTLTSGPVRTRIDGEAMAGTGNLLTRTRGARIMAYGRLDRKRGSVYRTDRREASIDELATEIDCRNYARRRRESDGDVARVPVDCRFLPGSAGAGRGDAQTLARCIRVDRPRLPSRDRLCREPPAMGCCRPMVLRLPGDPPHAPRFPPARASPLALPRVASSVRSIPRRKSGRPPPARSLPPTAPTRRSVCRVSEGRKCNG